MMARLLFTLTRLRVTIGYTSVLLAVAATLLVLGPRAHDIVVSHMSTNLHNLLHGHFGTLLGSALVTENGPIYVWLPGLACLLALAELFWRSGRLVFTFAIGHVGATLIVAVGLIAAIRFGWTPVSVARATDVGISYGAVAVLGALTAAVPLRRRSAWIGWWLAVGLAVVAFDRDFTDLGHVVALTLGMLVSLRFSSVERWTPARCVLLGVGASFGYLMLVNTGLPVIVAPLFGVTGAVAGHWAARWRSRRSPLTAVPVVIPEPVLHG
ncbi:MAG: hypothetical protein JO152_03595 [Mycobacteriaceae bacterium]|nr:hypothetical protein [Mycobacteriaceae bacterium]